MGIKRVKELAKRKAERLKRELRHKNRERFERQKVRAKRVKAQTIDSSLASPRRSWYAPPLVSKPIYQIWIEGSCGKDEPVLYYATTNKIEADRTLIGLLAKGEFAAIVRVDPKENESDGSDE
tara:strand:- start:1221 stop:1589 length:369 start_codon:yes stop_codon:yes gene_type:complete